MLKLTEDKYGIASFLTLFIIVWVFMFAMLHYGSDTENYGEFLFQAIIFSTLIALPVAFCCVLARGGVRDPKELTDGITIRY
ncbi:MAG: hypothetical protein RTV31_06495 [Candidatus Thorarchaeota archaeon]